MHGCQTTFLEKRLGSANGPICLQFVHPSGIRQAFAWDHTSNGLEAPNSPLFQEDGKTLRPESLLLWLSIGLQADWQEAVHL